MRLLAFFSLFLITAVCQGQQTDGIKFEKNLNWKQIKEKAKRENKYIFLDAYTTWCIPCKQMALAVFPHKDVGNFFNQNFVNVAVQFDVTKNDSKEVVSWHKDSKLMTGLYQINSYPTYLFFNPDGLLVHMIKGAIFKPAEFIASAKESLDPLKQLVGLKREYLNGKRDQKFLFTLINAAEKASDYTNLPEYVNAYLYQQKNKLTAENIKIAALGLSTKYNIAYEVILNNPDSVNGVLGKYKRAKLLNRIIFDDDVFPLLRTNGKINKSGLMISYEGEINKNVDWQKIRNYLNANYKELADFVYTDAKLTHAMWLKDWNGFNQTLDIYVSNGSDLDLEYLSGMISYLIAYSDQKEDAIAALLWAKVLLVGEPLPNYKKNYSRLLYKAERKDEAVALMQEYVNMKTVHDQTAIENIEKMKKGEKIYW